MLNKLLKAKRILDENPKVSLRTFIQKNGLTSKDYDFLISNNIIEKRGKTKGVSYYWVGKSPDYDMVQDMIGANNFSDTPSLLDVIVDKYEITLRVSQNVTLRLINNDKVSIRRDDGNEVVFSDPVRLKEVLSLIS
ncbi:MAG: hypothetical protein ACO393_06005 [Methylophilaceae bacterium]